MTQRILVAGVGSAEVARRLAKLALPDSVAVRDYGISGMHLAYDLADGVKTAILVDAMPRGGQPGTVYVVEPAPDPARRRGSSGMRREERSCVLAFPVR